MNINFGGRQILFWHFSDALQQFCTSIILMPDGELYSDPNCISQAPLTFGHPLSKGS